MTNMYYYYINNISFIINVKITFIIIFLIIIIVSTYCN